MLWILIALLQFKPEEAKIKLIEFWGGTLIMESSELFKFKRAYGLRLLNTEFEFKRTILSIGHLTLSSHYFEIIPISFCYKLPFNLILELETSLCLIASNENGYTFGMLFWIYYREKELCIRARIGKRALKYISNSFVEFRPFLEFNKIGEMYLIGGFEMSIGWRSK